MSHFQQTVHYIVHVFEICDKKTVRGGQDFSHTFIDMLCIRYMHASYMYVGATGNQAKSQ